MKFILSEPLEKKQFVFGDVAVNQFFVSDNGQLCQKVYSGSYLQMTNSKGKPYADFYNGVNDEEPIQRILPNVERIEY